ncbi:MAG: response regulator, partial [Planctomycetes bacterium]|nr:response regulator [Planctomycetota bacterium]
DAEGGGTVARVTLPTLADQTEHTPAQGESPGNCSDHLSILVVDDDENVREPLRRYLEQAGHSVSVASTGTEALALLDGGMTLDVLLTDLTMPGADGFALARHAAQRHPRADVVLMTARAATLNKGAARAAGIKAVVGKPFAMQTIDSLLLDRSKGQVN